MCKNGCYGFYEKSYVFITDGIAAKNKRCNTAERLNEILSSIVGNSVNNWSGSKKYYEWHRKESNKHQQMLRNKRSARRGMFVMHINKPTAITLLIIASVSILGIVVVDSKTSNSEVLHSVFVALLVSCIFYIGTVVLPEMQRRKRIRKGLKKRYHLFKMSCIDLFLIVSDSQEYNYIDRENLLNHEEFRRYFNILVKGTQSRWDLVATSIDDGDYIFEELVMEFEHLIYEINHARTSVEIFDDDVDEFFSGMTQTVHRLKLTKPGTDDYKYFCRTLWTVFTRWNWTDGQREDDFIETMIERI